MPLTLLSIFSSLTGWFGLVVDEVGANLRDEGSYSGEKKSLDSFFHLNNKKVYV